MEMTIKLSIDPAKSDGTQSIYEHIQDVLGPLLAAGWIIHEYDWRTGRVDRSGHQTAELVLRWGE